MSIDQICMNESDWAMEMLMRTKVLECCNRHEGVYYEGGNDVESAYKYGIAVHKNDVSRSPFNSITELTDAIKIAYEDHVGNDKCPVCYRGSRD